MTVLLIISVILNGILVDKLYRQRKIISDSKSGVKIDPKAIPLVNSIFDLVIEEKLEHIVFQGAIYGHKVSSQDGRLIADYGCDTPYLDVIKAIKDWAGMDMNYLQEESGSFAYGESDCKFIVSTKPGPFGGKVELKLIQGDDNKVNP
jgi:hypothetical protein